MGDTTTRLDDAARIKLSIGTAGPGDTDGVFEEPLGMAFDHHRGLLFVVDSNNHRVQVFSSDDGSFVSKFGEYGIQPGQFQNPWGLAIGDDEAMMMLVDRNAFRIEELEIS